MAQLHCYVSEEVAESLRQRAAAEGKSVSAVLGALVRREVSVPSWPADFFERVVGGWQGTELERSPQPAVDRRETI